MTMLQNIWADLLEKKIYLVAVVTLLALTAVSFMYLSKPGPPTTSATVPPAPADTADGPELSLTRSSVTGFARAPRVNDKRVDPFGSGITKKFEKELLAYLQAAKDVENGGSTQTDLGGGSVDTSGSTGGGSVPNTGGGGGGVTPTPPDDTDKPPKTTPVKTEKDDLLTVLLTTAQDAEAKEIEDIRTLSPLPDSENPFLVYVGKAGDDKVSFLVSADVTVTGDGVCAPSPTDCRTLTMAVGDTADFVLLTKENAKISLTVTDLVTKKVPVTGDPATEEAAQLEATNRAIGAKALRSVIRDEVVLTSLVRNGVKIRH